MILKELRLKNFKQHVNSTIKFKAGITCISGLNGAGKSSIPLAIKIALFGSEACDTDVKDIMAEMATDKECSIELDIMLDKIIGMFEFLTIEKEVVTIVRIFKGKNMTPSAFVRVNGKEVATSAKTVSSEVERLIGMNYKSFSVSYFAKQKELNHLTSLRGAERRSLIIKMRGYENIDNVIKLIRTDLDVEKKLKIELEKNIDTEITKCEYCQTDLDKINNELNIHTDAMEKIKKEYSGIKNELKLIEDSHEQFIIADKSLSSYESLLTKSKNSIASLSDDLELLINDSLDILKINEDKKVLAGKLDEMSKEKFRLTKELAAKKQGGINYEEQIGKLAVNYKLLASNKTNASCPVCRTALDKDKFESVMHNYTEEGKEIKLKIQRNNEDVASTEKSISELDKIINIEKENLEQITNKHNELLSKENRINSIRISIKKEQLNEESYAKSISEIKAEINNIKYDKNKHEASKEICDRCVNEISSLQSLILNATKNKNNIQNVLDKYAGDEQLVQKNKELLRNTTDKIQKLSETAEHCSGFRIALMQSLRPEIENASSEIFNEITNGKYAGIELSEDYDVFINTGSCKWPIEKFSGGENDIANFCLRMGISKIISQSSGHSEAFVILDEIFGSQDKARSQNIIKMLKKINNLFPQIILITHMDNLLEEFDNVIRVEETEKWISKIY